MKNMTLSFFSSEVAAANIPPASRNESSGALFCVTNCSLSGSCDVPITTHCHCEEPPQRRRRGNLLFRLRSVVRYRRLPRRFAPRNDTKFKEFCERRAAALSPHWGDKSHFQQSDKLKFVNFYFTSCQGRYAVL